MESFQNWVETMTSTNCIAGFSRITIPMIKRSWPNWDSWKKKKKVYEQPQVKETNDPRCGCVCPHCGSKKTEGARCVEKDKDGNFVKYANTICNCCGNGFSY